MPPMNPQRYPIGLQTFSELREGGYLYVDKTDLVYQLVNECARYIFFARPPRFGKTLLLSTLKAYFEGRKDLFEGLAIERLETEWKEYPVLYFDLSVTKRMNKEELEAELMRQMAEYEKVYGVDEIEEKYTNIRIRHLVWRVSEKTGKKVVILIDDYDASFLDETKDEKALRDVRYAMDNFFAPFKGLDVYLKFFFMTGTTRYASDFLSGILNNLSHFSGRKEYASLCGITEEEMLTQMRSGIESLAEAEGLSYEETVGQLKQTYGGHRFAWPSPNMYNPYSLLRALEEKKVGNYWFDDDLKAYLNATLKKYDETLEKLENVRTFSNGLYVPMEMVYDSSPILFQMGLLTIKDYEREKFSLSDSCTLGIPNEEARSLLKVSQS